MSIFFYGTWPSNKFEFETPVLHSENMIQYNNSFFWVYQHIDFVKIEFNTMSKNAFKSKKSKMYQ
jgi:hypothetical protein